MSRNKPYRILPMLVLITALFLSGCGLLIQPVTTSGIAPTPVVRFERGGVEDPNVFVDLAAFQAALLQALTGRDTMKLQMWMTGSILTGTWRADLSDTSPADAVKSLYIDQLGAENHLTLVKNADLKALMGGKDPLSILRGEVGVTDAFLVSGWGKDGRDEALLFVARQANNSLKWHGWMVIKGGFSGARLGGLQPYQNDANGYSLFLPKDDQVIESNATEVLVLAPGQGHPGETRAAAFIFVEPADGRSVEQVVEAVKAEYPSGFNITVDSPIDIDDAKALVVNGLPGQDSNRQLFMVHSDLLYHITFVPDNPQLGDAYQQMEDIYTMVVNTFHFTK
jgi:hypothetical protein